jgi:hypothetical protein
MADDEYGMPIADQLTIIARSLGVLNRHLIDIKGHLEKVAVKMPSQPPGNVR